MKQNITSRGGLQKKLTLVILSIVSLVLLMTSTLFIGANYFFANKILKKEANTISQFTAHQVETAIIFDHKEGVIEALNDVIKRSNIIQATVHQQNGEVYVSTGIEKKTTKFNQQQCKTKSFYSKKLNSCDVVKDGNKTIAYIHLVFSREALFNQQVTQIFIFILSILISLIFSLIVTKYFSRSLTSPLNNLAKLTNQIAKDKDFSSRAKVAGTAEIITLNQSFNKMLDEIEVRDKELKNYTTNLEWLIEEKTASLKIALKKANHANASKSEFLANMSHELRTPLHGILSFARFGLKNYETATTEKLFKYFDRIHTSGERLLALLNDLLDLSKLEAGKMELNKQNKSLFKAAKNCVAEQSASLKEKQLILLWENEACDSEAYFDLDRINQVISNLLSNAIKFSPERKIIRIQFSKIDYHNHAAIQLTVEDQGVGIPKKELKHIFDKFIQSSKTKTNAGGTGLGLAICQDIIGLHKGKIWAESIEGGGARVSFVLPVR
jgi:signal transduction histidine kinase